MSTVKDLIGQAVDRLADDLDTLSRKIHDNPELAYQEVKAAGWLSDFLTGQGFKVERGVAGVETAFRATVETGAGPTIAILCEYDALPAIGHACGHNVIATAGAGAGAALAAVRDKLPAGRIQVIGTPAEEGGGGKAAHASADPWEGVNALDAVIQTFNNVSMLRQQMRPEARIHGIVTQGGAAPNIIPEVAACTFYVRAAKLDYMWDLRKRVVACAEGAAQATGCTLTVVDFEAPYEPLKRNDTLLDLFRANMKTAGAVESPPMADRMGSSDIGNVSQVIPAIQPMVQIAPPGTPIHSRAFEAAAVSTLARQGMCQAAKTMAMTTYDLLADPGLVKRARSEFEAAK